MASLEQALALAAQGFHVFPVHQDSKLPAIPAWQDKATTDPEKIKAWWLDPVLGMDQDWNIGICTTRFNCAEALIVIDIDCKNGKNGHEEIIKLEIEGKDLPASRATATPTGGGHLFYRTTAAVSNGVDVLARGLDIRSRGGYVVGPGSTVGEGRYVGNDAEVAPAPEWLVNELSRRVEPARTSVAPAGEVDQERAAKRAIEYLKAAPIAVQGEGGDHTTFQVACKLKDIGVGEGDAFSLMLEWNDRCDPPWSPEELESKVANAYRYGKNSPGVDAPEVQFPKSDDVVDGGKHPLQTINDGYAFIKKGCFILHESANDRGEYEAIHYSVPQLHYVFSNKMFQVGNRAVTLSKAWMEWAGRREYKGVVFSPEKPVGSEWYNLWRGFAVKPAATPDHPSVEMFKEHALQNVCGGDPKLYAWLMGWFAHVIQRPYEKPLTALVFKGDKGTGKNALVERVGYLLGGHFMVADDDRYLTSNFNSHMEGCLFIVMDEACWAGDKRHEGKLKGLITGKFHVIERKGEEPYKVDNLTRVAIIGNENWLVPATEDERRYAVFNVGDGRRQDRKFFEAMRVGMEQGGYAHLLRFLMDFPVSDVNQAPETKGLVEQKLESMGPFGTFWYSCLRAEAVVGSEFSGWPATINKDRMRDTFYKWMKDRGYRQMRPSEHSIGQALRKMAPSVETIRPMENGVRHMAYTLPSIEELRTEFERWVKGPVDWG